jgi:hypothetical protein
MAGRDETDETIGSNGDEKPVIQPKYRYINRN